jgi:enediyne biosynthesis protein E4
LSVALVSVSRPAPVCRAPARSVARRCVGLGRSAGSSLRRAGKPRSRTASRGIRGRAWKLHAACWLVLGAVSLSLAQETAPEKSPGFALIDIAEEAGLNAKTVCGRDGNPTILDGTGPGLALLDYDGDGRLDLYLVNGGTSYERGEVHVANVLYRNVGDGRFVDVTASAGVGDRRFGQGAVAADIDGDGDTDLYVTNYGRNTLYRNQGDGTFKDDTGRGGVGDDGWGTGAAFADVDRDGDLDLYVANYVGFDARTTPRRGNPRCLFMGVKVFCGPRGLTPLQDILYRNRGDGTFENGTAAAGLSRSEPYYGLGVVFGDVDDDGDPDLYVANDATPNLLYLNQGNGTFQEEGLLRGVAFGLEGNEQAGMGVDLGDYDGDGLLDLVVTNFSHDTHSLYRNEGSLFELTTFRAGLGETTLDRLGWAVAFVDFDADGWDDLFVSNGHVYPQMDGRGLGTTYRQPNQVFLNQGDGTFRDVSALAGEGMGITESSRGAVFGDLDNDGDPDVVVVNLDARPTLLRNDRAAPHHWIGLQLEGRAPNRAAIGARVRLVTEGRAQVREVRAGSGFLSSSDPRLLFGLGSQGAGQEVEIRWPDGSRSRHRGLAADRYHVLSQPAESP